MIKLKNILLRKLRRLLLPKDVYDLVEDIGAKNSHKVIDKIENYIPDNGNIWQQYFGEEITIHKNRQSSPGHPKSFLCYITIQEARYLRSLGLGYSLHVESGEFRQHCGKFGIPSFQGGDGDGGGGDGGGGSGGNGGLGSGGSQGATGNSGTSAGFGTSHDSGYSGHGSSTGGGGDGGLGALGLGGYGEQPGQINGTSFGGFNNNGDTESFGFLGSLAAKLTGSYAIGLAVDTISSMVSAMMGAMNAISGFSLGGVIGFGLGMLSAINAKTAIDHIGIMGSSSDEGLANTDAHVNDNIGHDAKTIQDTIQKQLTEKALQKDFISDVMTAEIFGWLAGGSSYNAVFAGGDLFNSLGIINPLGKSLGFDAKVDTSFIDDINFPYSTNAGGGAFTNFYFGVPLAGDSNFSPLKWG